MEPVSDLGDDYAPRFFYYFTITQMTDPGVSITQCPEQSKCDPVLLLISVKVRLNTKGQLMEINGAGKRC